MIDEFLNKIQVWKTFFSLKLFLSTNWQIVFQWQSNCLPQKLLIIPSNFRLISWFYGTCVFFGWTMSVWAKCMAMANRMICTWLLGFYTTNRVSAIWERYQPSMGGIQWQWQSRGSHQAIGNTTTADRTCSTLDPRISSCVSVWGKNWDILDKNECVWSCNPYWLRWQEVWGLGFSSFNTRQPLTKLQHKLHKQQATSFSSISSFNTRNTLTKPCWQEL